MDIYVLTCLENDTILEQKVYKTLLEAKEELKKRYNLEYNAVKNDDILLHDFIDDEMLMASEDNLMVNNEDNECLYATLVFGDEPVEYNWYIKKFKL